MKRLVNWLLGSHSTSHRSTHRSQFIRPRLEALEDRQLMSATSWADSYHPAVVSAVQQERSLDQVGFAIAKDHTVVETVGVWTFSIGTYPGAINGGYAVDIDAGRDLAGHAQCLVHGPGNTLALYNVITGWKNLTFNTPWGDGVWQISAGNTGRVFALDSGHRAFEFNFTSDKWDFKRSLVTEIQAGRHVWDDGLFVRDDALNVWHDTSTGWVVLGADAHALSVNANNSVFMIGNDTRVWQLDWSTKTWSKLGDFPALAINAVTNGQGGDLVYAFGVPYDPSEVDCDTCGLARGLWIYQSATGWQDLGIGTIQFSGAGAGSSLYVSAYNPATDITEISVYDWSSSSWNYLCDALDWTKWAV